MWFGWISGRGFGISITADQWIMVALGTQKKRLVRETSKNGTTVGAERPGIEVSGNSVFVTWMDGRDGEPSCYTMPKCSQVYFKRSLDGGNTWGPDVRLTSEPTYSARPVVTSIANKVFIAYDHSQVNDGNDAYLLESDDGGTSWSSAQRMSYSAAARHTTTLAADPFLFCIHGCAKSWKYFLSNVE
jgi:hypothetical protein